MNETGPIAFARAESVESEYEILPHNLFVEILDESGESVPPGERGEIVVTGGVNPFLPLVRYRTGDFGALSFRSEIPHLIRFEQRLPVNFRAVSGEVIPSISVTVVLFRIPLPFFSLHQATNGSLLFRTRCDSTAEQNIRQALHELFGPVPLTVEQVGWEVAWRGKTIQYSSEPAAS
jgi:phenylacetate-CoA ligase